MCDIHRRRPRLVTQSAIYYPELDIICIKFQLLWQQRHRFDLEATIAVMLAEPLHDLAGGRPGSGLPRIRTSCIALDAMGEAFEVS